MSSDVSPELTSAEKQGPTNEAPRVPAAGTLQGRLSVLAVAAITISFITPTASVFIIAPVAFSSAGTAAFLSFVIGAVIALGLAYCYAELGAALPFSGGEYVFASKVISPSVGFVTLILWVCQGVFGITAIALGAAAYLEPIFPGADPHLVAVILIGFATVIALFQIKRGAAFTATFLVLELLAILIVSVLGFAHAHNSLSLLTSPKIFPATGGSVAAGIGVVFTGVTFALYSFNGYGSAVYFAEETGGPHRRVAKAVILSLAVAVVAELVPITALILGTPSLTHLSNSSAPVTELIEHYASSGVANIVSVIVALAVFNSVIAAVMGFARIIYSAGRDGAWPGPVSRAMATVLGRTHAPVGATIALGGGCMILAGLSDVATTVTFTGVLVGVIFFLVAASALCSRVLGRPSHRPYAMPFWPVPAVVGAGGTFYVLAKQTAGDLRSALLIALGAAIYYLAFLLRSWGWRPWDSAPSEAGDQRDGPGAE
jgi:amino acid transporter